MSVKRYACKFCIALRGLNSAEVPALPETFEAAMQHIISVHRYPEVSAEDILGDREAQQRDLAARIINRTGPVLEVYV